MLVHRIILMSANSTESHMTIASFLLKVLNSFVIKIIFSLSYCGITDNTMKKI